MSIIFAKQTELGAYYITPTSKIEVLIKKKSDSHVLVQHNVPGYGYQNVWIKNDILLEKKGEKND